MGQNGYNGRIYRDRKQIRMSKAEQAKVYD